MSNDQFEDGAPFGPDDATREVYHFAWSMYDDLYEHRLRGRHRLSPQQRRVFARCVLFLRSGLPYEWPKHAKWLWRRQREKVEPDKPSPWWKPDELALAGLPFWGHRIRKWRRRLEEQRDSALKQRGIVDDRIWPFRRMADYKAALKNPPYLAGNRAG